MPLFRTATSLLLLLSLLMGVGCAPPDPEAPLRPAFLPGGRVLMDAHNCYPYQGRWADRIDRALGTGAPLAVEQDLVWYTDTETGKSWSLVSHGEELSGEEPLMGEYFFERIRPLVEEALADGDRSDWPLVTLNLDFKTDEPEHHAAVWELLGEYESWLTTAPRGEDRWEIRELELGPVLVLTGTNEVQEKTFHEAVPVGGRLRVFGAVQTSPFHVDKVPEEIIVGRPSNYRRWFNSSWHSVERGGIREAGEWTTENRERLEKLVRYAHDQGLWVRFYSLNGHPPEEDLLNGWNNAYNFGSLADVRHRWRAVVEVGVDFVATDQYEEFARFRDEVLVQSR